MLLMSCQLCSEPLQSLYLDLVTLSTSSSQSELEAETTQSMKDF